MLGASFSVTTTGSFSSDLVLPYKFGGKLLFPLCRTCAESESSDLCTCNDADRTIHGRFCTPELHKAVELGYKIIQIYEVHHWAETTQYDPASKSGGLFAGYITLFLKYKQEFSGRPSDIDRDQYMQDALEKEGIVLDPKSVQTNLALRSLAKLCLNSCWGKFGQGENKTQASFFNNTQVSDFF